MNSDLLTHIFIRTNDNDIKKLRLVCKNFKNIIDNDFFWINKIIYSFPALKYNIERKDYKKYYFELIDIFKEKNLNYISSYSQEYEKNDILLILSSYKNFKHSELIVNVYERDIIKEIYYVNPENNFKEGKYISYYKNRKVKQISIYKNNEKNGFSLLKDSENNMTEFSHYKNGYKHGRCKYFVGTIKIICNYFEGYLNGKFESYIDDIIFEQIHYIENYQNGKYLRYHYNGKLKEKGNYKNDMKEGLWTYYDLEGNLIEEVEFTNILNYL